MAQSDRDNAENVVPLRRSHRTRRDEGRGPGRDIAGAVRSFDRLERCAAVLHSGSLGIADGFDGTKWSIVSFQVQLLVIQNWLDQLTHINVTTWSDTRWVLRLTSARAIAALRLSAVRRSLRRTPPGTGQLDSQLSADIRELAEALRRLRLLIIQQYAEGNTRAVELWADRRGQPL